MPYEVTPTLSVEALQTRIADVVVVNSDRKFVGAEGGFTSAHALVATVARAGAERLPALSFATTETAWVVPHARSAEGVAGTTRSALHRVVEIDVVPDHLPVVPGAIPCKTQLR